jgi:glycine/D-amino acid oxidase-like deaminating enzyme
MLTIAAKALGRKKPLFEDYSVPPPAALAAGQPVTLRDLIGHVVRAEVAAFQQRQAERRLLKALTAKQIADALETGKVQAGGSELDQHVDPEQAVATALEACTDGLFLVVVDETEVTDLDSVVPLTESSRLTFIRFTMLAGG